MSKVDINFNGEITDRQIAFITLANACGKFYLTVVFILLIYLKLLTIIYSEVVRAEEIMSI